MKRRDYQGRFNLRLLTEQLFTTFPQWARDDPFGEPPGAKVTDVSVSASEDGVTVLVPDEAVDAAVDALVAAHNPDAKSRGELGEEKRATDRASARSKLQALGLTPDEIDAL